MDLSVVIPLYNEKESLPELVEWISRVMKENDFSYEIILVDDGSNDGSWQWIAENSLRDNRVKGIKFRRNYGKSAALNTGFAQAQGDVIITMDADLQDSPDEIPDLYKMIKHDDFDLVSGWKRKRHDPIAKTIPSKFFNWTTRKMSGINNLHDFNCGLKAYKNIVVKSIEVYGEMHRYIPLIAKWEGFRNIGEKVVEHRARKYGHTKFGMERFVKGFLDLLSISFVTRFGKRPMHLFGLIGTLSFLAGGLVSLWLVGEKIYFNLQDKVVRNVTDQSLFYIALTAMMKCSHVILRTEIPIRSNKRSISEF